MFDGLQSQQASYLQDKCQGATQQIGCTLWFAAGIAQYALQYECIPVLPSNPEKLTRMRRNTCSSTKRPAADWLSGKNAVLLRGTTGLNSTSATCFVLS